MIQNAYFDYIDITDFIKILDYFITKKPLNKFYNIGTGKKVSLLSIAKKINKLGKYSMRITVQKKGLNKEYTCNNKRLINELKAFSPTTIDDSLRKLYDFYKQNIDNVDKMAISEDKYNK